MSFRCKRKKMRWSASSPAGRNSVSPLRPRWSRIHKFFLSLTSRRRASTPQSVRRQLWDIIRQFQQRNGTVLLTTHYMDEAERLSDRIAIVDHGQIIA